MHEIFKEKLNQTDIGNLNLRKKTLTHINDGSFSQIEMKYLRQDDTKTLLMLLANIFHRIYEIPIRENGNDVSDIKLIKNKLNIEIQLYGLDKLEIYTGNGSDIKVYLLLSDSHFEVISSLTPFIGTNVYHNRKKEKCYACNNPTKCLETKNTMQCDTCFKLFCGRYVQITILKMKGALNIHTSVLSVNE